MKQTYKKAGVDVDAANYAVRLIKQHAAQTYLPGVIGDIGGFGGFFQLDLKKYKEPVLVSGADGVGTKLKIAFAADRHDTIGIDCVAMCINDILVHGAQPLFFLDYIAVGKLIPEKIADIVKGVAEGCKLAECALVGGETAEMPGMYAEGEYDIAGFAVGIVDRNKIINGSLIKAGDAIIGIASSGLHSNGFSLARKVLLEIGKLNINDYIPELGKTLKEEMLVPTRIYTNAVKSIKGFAVKGMAHITGGGFIENLPRILPEGLEIKIFKGSWEIPPIFELIQKLGQIDETEMYRTFNMGIGFAVVVPKSQGKDVLKKLSDEGERAWLIGQVTEGKGGVVLCQN